MIPQTLSGTRQCRVPTPGRILVHNLNRIAIYVAVVHAEGWERAIAWHFAVRLANGIRAYTGKTCLRRFQKSAKADASLCSGDEKSPRLQDMRSHILQQLVADEEWRDRLSSCSEAGEWNNSRLYRQNLPSQVSKVRAGGRLVARWHNSSKFRRRRSDAFAK